MKYGLIGEKLPHSYSKTVHESFADYEYELMELKPEELGGFMRRADFQGINVTIPYKVAVIPYLDEVDPAAKRIGAVNTVVKRNGRLLGYNTDYFGLKKLAERVAGNVSGKTALILGTGGTSLTARAVLTDAGARVVTVSRTPKNGEIEYADAEKLSDARILINTTPVGMFPRPGASPINLDGLTGLEAVIDAIYNPIRTELILEAQKRGLKAEGGLYMLIAQAVKASELFTGSVYPDGLADGIYRKIRNEKENIVLTGMPGSGKSTVGAIIAGKLGRRLLDTDKLIEERAGKSVTEIFAARGEKAFRDLESEVIREISENVGGAVIATGGGAVLREENVRRLKRTGRIFFLDRPPELLIPTPDRPLALSAEAIMNRYRERIGIYRSTADTAVDGSGTPEEVAGLVMKERES